MPDEEKDEGTKIEKTAKAIKALADSVPIYNDLVQPPAKELGQSLETIAKLINSLLAPVRGIIWTADRGEKKVADFVSTALSKKLQNVPQERIIQPNPMISGPILEKLRFTVDEPTLRELFINLLAKAMDQDTVMEAHPSFVEIISQLTPDEALILKYVSRNRTLPILTLRVIDKSSKPARNSRMGIDFEALEKSTASGQDYVKNFSIVGELAGCSHIDWTQGYIENLARLGLVNLLRDYAFTDKERYDPLKTHPDILEFIEKIAQFEGKEHIFVLGMLELTTYGNFFCNSCVEHPNTE